MICMYIYTKCFLKKWVQIFRSLEISYKKKLLVLFQFWRIIAGSVFYLHKKSDAIPTTYLRYIFQLTEYQALYL